jgi:D-3-phosphoglycerate dehydrogenase
MPKVFIATTSFGEHDPAPLEILKQRRLEPLRNPLRRSLKENEILEFARGCAGIIAGTERYDREVLCELRDLKIISRCGVGLDTIDLQAAMDLGIAVASTPYGPTEAVAELTVGLILNLIRRVENSSVALKRGCWEKHMGFLMRELTIGIIGLGRIGRRVAALLKGFNASVLGDDIQPDREWAAAQGVRLVDRGEVLKKSDVVSLHVPYEQRLHHLIGPREIEMMKPNSYLINTSRGGLVEEGALCAALKAGRLAGAAIDTFEQEPYGGPLRALDNVILTPHIGSYARAGRIKMERESVENILAKLSW